MINEASKKFVPVAKFRQTYDRLLHVVNVDYHACVGVKEITNWLQIVDRSLSELLETDCKRASEADRRWYRLAIESARKQIENAGKRIERLEIEERFKNYCQSQKDTIH